LRRERGQPGCLDLRGRPQIRSPLRSLTPIPVQRHLFAACSHQDSYDNQVLTDRASPVSESEARAVLEHYRFTPGLAEELRYGVSNLIVSGIIMGLTRTEALRLAEDVRSQLQSDAASKPRAHLPARDSDDG